MVTVKRIAGGRLFQLGRRQSEARRHGRRDAAARQLHDRVRCQAGAALRRLCRRVGDHAGHLADPHRAAATSRTAASPCSTAIATARSVIFLDALADLKDRYMGRFELYHFLAEEEGDVELFNGMLDRATLRRCDRASGRRSGKRRRLVHLRPRADDGRRGSGAARARRRQGPHPHRALHRRSAVGGAGRRKWRSCRPRRRR